MSSPHHFYIKQLKNKNYLNALICGVWIVTSLGVQANTPPGDFISQFKDSTNINASVSHNEDCATTSLCMVAKHFGALSAEATSPKQVEATIRKISKEMEEGPSDNWVINGAEKLGLKSKSIAPNAAAVSEALHQGKMVIVAGDPMAPGAFGPKHGYKHKTRHYIVISRQKPNGEYVVFDPAGHTHSKDKGVYSISEKELNGFLNSNEPGLVIGHAIAIGR
jgi:hypothetical protein